MSNKIFKSIRAKAPRRNAFDLTHDKKLSCNMGDLIPVFLQDVVPGDKFRVSSEIWIRFAPLLAPIMHRVNAYVHYYFVPNRLVFDQWENFITGGIDGKQAPPFPVVNDQDLAMGITDGSGNPAALNPGSLADYLGITMADNIGTGELDISVLPFRAYQLIYNEYFRDQTLTPAVPLQTGSTVTGSELAEIVKLRKRSWEKDYFTSALPFAQRGDQVLLPLEDSAPVTFTPTNTPAQLIASGTQFGSNNVDLQGQPNTGNEGTLIGNDPGSGTTMSLNVVPSGSYTADLQSASATSINDLRRSIRLQEWLEKQARGGSRYIETILNHFGTRNPDYRLQRPEYLGGGKSPVVISETLQTSSTDATSPQGNPAGRAVSAGRTNRFTKYFTEHGYVIGIMSIMPRTAYMQGVPKHFLKADRFDFYWPSFAHLGEQPILNAELYSAAGVNANGIFGYTPRYAEYKYAINSVHGDFRTTLDHWHMARKFDAAPALNADFIASDPTDRIFSVEDGSHALWCHIVNNCRAIRPMPVYGTPTI